MNIQVTQKSKQLQNHQYIVLKPANEIKFFRQIKVSCISIIIIVVYYAIPAAYRIQLCTQTCTH